MPELETGASAPAEPTIDTTPPPVGQDTAPSMDDTLEAAWNKSQSNGVDRGENGRFESDKPADPPKEELAAQPPKEEVKPETAVAVPAIDPPNSWTAEAKANVWPKLTPEAQKVVADRELQAHKAITSYGERVKSYEPLDKVITQYKSHFDRHGIQPAQSFAALIEAQQMLDQNPVEGLINIARSYGIDLGAVLNGQQATLPAHDPRVGQVQQELSHIKQTIEQQRQQQEQAQLAEVSALIESFKKDHPHYDALESDIEDLLPGIVRANPGLSPKERLAKAYDKASWANETIRARIQEDQRIADEKKRKELTEKAEAEAKAKAEEAKKSARLNVKGSVAHPNPKTMDDTLEEIARRAYG